MTLRLLKAPELVQGELLATIEGMSCDHVPALGEWGCRERPLWALVIYVPSKTQDAPGHRHLRLFHHEIHYCEAHKGDARLDALLTVKMMTDFEKSARRLRPLDFRCDFEAAHIAYVSIFEPRYFDFLKSVAEARAAVERDFGGALVAR